MIVGRSEVLRPAKEQEYLAMSRDPDEQQKLNWQVTVDKDRFGLAYKKRVEALAGASDRKVTAVSQ